MRAIIIFTLLAAVSASLDKLEQDCPDGWHMYNDKDLQLCMRLMDKPQMYEDAFKECHGIHSELMTIVRSVEKIEFVNDLIIKKYGERNGSLWFFDGQHVQKTMLETRGRILNEDRTVMQPAEDPADIKLYTNAEDVPRHFICEKPAMPIEQLPRFARQPEDAMISDEELPREDGERRERIMPARLAFICQAIGKPQPELEWIMVEEDRANNTLDTERIETRVVYNRRELQGRHNVEKPVFYEVRSDCKTRVCNAQSTTQISELFVIGAQFLRRNASIACVAKNTFGSVISREARIVITEMEDSPKEIRRVFVTEGKNITIPCDIDTKPDTAAVEWHRIEKRWGNERRVPLKELNRRSRGAIQVSKATFDLVIDLAQSDDAGEYECEVRLHNGRRGFSRRELKIELVVERCEGECDTKDNKIDVVEGYPTVLSMNPMSNEFIRTGDDYLLECPCFGKRDHKELLRVEWDMEHEIAQVLPVLPIGSAVLMRNANESFSGPARCRCVRRDQEGKMNDTSEWSEMNVRVLPLIKPTLSKVEVVEAGKPVSIVMQLPKVKITDLEIAVTPMRGDDSLNDILAEKNDERFSLTKTDENVFTIAIDAVEKKDADAYGCRVSVNYFGKWTEIDYHYTSLIVKE